MSAGAGNGWIDDSVGHGPAYRFTSPAGQTHELFWENEMYVAPPGMESPFPDRPQRFVPRGVAPRQIDHVTVMTKDPVADAKWFRDVLGSTFTEYTLLNEDTDLVVFAMSTNNEKSHDLGLILDQSDVPGRIHHFAWWVDSREELLRAADILLNADVRDRVRARTARHGRAGVPVPPRAGWHPGRDQHRRLPTLRPRLGDQALGPVPGFEHVLPERRRCRTR